MKKTVSLILVAVMIVSVTLIACFGGYAAVTGQDVMDRIEGIIGKTYPGVFSQLEAVYSKVEVTDEMAAELMPLIDEFAKIYEAGENSEEGYTAEHGNRVMDLFDQASDIVGFNYVFHNVDGATNPNLNPDIVTVEIFDEDNNKLGVIEGEVKDEGPELGDVNYDGSVDAADATLVLQYFAEIIDFDAPGYYHSVSDVGGHEGTTAVDATLILQYFAKIIPALPNAK